MTIGKWVNHALIAAADSEQRNGPTEAMAPGSTAVEREWVGSLVVEPTADDAERRERAIRALTERRGVKKRPPEEKQKPEEKQIQQAPWSVRGVSDEALSKTKKSAADRHMTIGKWVSHALVAVADSELQKGMTEAMAPGSTPHEPVSARSPVAEPAADDAELSDRKPPPRRAKTVPAAAAPGEPQEIARAVESLTRHIEESPKSEQAFASLAEHRDGLGRAEQQMSELAKRFANLDQRDNALLALARRTVDSQNKSEQRLAALTTAMSLLADRVGATGGQALSGGSDIDRSLASIISALGSLAANVNGAPGAPPAAAAGDDQPPAPEQEAAGGTPVAPAAPAPPVDRPKFDFDRLNEKAIENTKPLHPEAHELAAKDKSSG